MSGAELRHEACDVDAGLAGHAQVEDRDRRLPQLDLLDRVVAVAGPSGDLDPVLREDVGDRLDDRGMIVGHEHRGDSGPVSHVNLGSFRLEARASGGSMRGLRPSPTVCIVHRCASGS